MFACIRILESQAKAKAKAKAKSKAEPKAKGQRCRQAALVGSPAPPSSTHIPGAGHFYTHTGQQKNAYGGLCPARHTYRCH